MAVIEGLDRPVQVERRMPAAEKPSSERHRALSESTSANEIPLPPPELLEEAEARLSDLSRLPDLLAPSAITISPDLLTIDEEHARIIVVQHLPRVVTAGWLKPLADLDEPLEVSFHLHPLDSAFMVQQLRRRQMEYQSSYQVALQRGHAFDPHLKVAEADVSALIERLASGEERLLDVSMHLLLRGATREQLQERTERVMALLHSLLLVARIAYFEQERAFRSCLPHARNHLGAGILLDSCSASTMFPFLSQTLFHPTGILEGITPAGDPVALAVWSEQMPNANRIILGPPGWGKSYQVKASIIRMALTYALAQQRNETQQRQGQPAVQVIVIDPEREYGRLAWALGGQVIRLAPGSAHHLNPFDLPTHPQQTVTGPVEPSLSGHGDRLADHLQMLHSLLEIMLADRTPEGTGKLSAQEKGLLDRALFETYRRVGITSDTRTHDRPAPLMRDLYEVLESGSSGEDETRLAARLQRYVSGSLAGIFAGPTNVALDQAMIVFDLHDLESELRPVGLFLVSHFVWTQSFQSRIPRQLIVDEAATLYQYESGARFLEDLVRRARKHYLGVTVITQHPLLFKDRSIIANCAVQILMRQDATALDLLQEIFKLSGREVHLLKRLGVGEALLLVQEHRLHVRFEVSELEHLLATTDPRELASWHSDGDPQPLLERLGTFDDYLEQELPPVPQSTERVPKAPRAKKRMITHQAEKRQGSTHKEKEAP
jgi:hypothetical protein